MDGKFMATLGYVQIEFAQSANDLVSAMKTCHDGLERGASLDLYFRHMDRARARDLELKQPR